MHENLFWKCFSLEAISKCVLGVNLFLCKSQYLKDQLIRTICEPALDLKLLFGKCAGLQAPDDIWELLHTKECPKHTCLFWNFFLKRLIFFSPIITTLSSVWSFLVWKGLTSVLKDKQSHYSYWIMTWHSEAGINHLRRNYTCRHQVKSNKSVSQNSRSQEGNLRINNCRTAPLLFSIAWKAKSSLAYFSFHFYPVLVIYLRLLPIFSLEQSYTICSSKHATYYLSERIIHSYFSLNTRYLLHNSFRALNPSWGKEEKDVSSYKYARHDHKFFLSHEIWDLPSTWVFSNHLNGNRVHPSIAFICPGLSSCLRATCISKISKNISSKL